MNKNAQINVEVEMKVAIIGASGYVGAELTKLLVNHAKIELNHLLVSENSDSTGLLFLNCILALQISATYRWKLFLANG